MSNFESSIECLIKKTANEKKYLEGELVKPSDFQTATTKVDSLSRDCVDEVVMLIEQICSKVESKYALIEKLDKNTDVTSSTLWNSSIGRLLKRPVPKQCSSASNKTSSGKKKPRNHEEALSAFKEAHQKKCQQLLDDQKSLLGHIIKLQTNSNIISQNSVANMRAELDEIAQKCNDAQVQLQALSRQLRIENEKLKFEMNRYIAEYMNGTDFNENIVNFKIADSFNSYLRVSKIEQRLEIVDYVKKNVPDDQLTVEILDYLDESARTKPFKKPVTVALFKQIEDLKYLIKADDQLNKTISDRVDIIVKMNKEIEQEEKNGDLLKAEEYKHILSGQEEDLEDMLEQLVVNRLFYAAKYCPEQKDNFVQDENLPALLDDLIAEAADHKFLTSKKTLRDRLRHLTEKLSEEYDQVITLSEPTSNSTSCSGLADALVSQKNIDLKSDEVVVQIVGDVNAGVANGEQVDEQI